MPKSRKPANPEKRKVGRPSSYLPEYSKKAFKLCLLGATDKELADFFDVSEQTLNAWKKEFPEFLESLKAGKIEADARVSHKLYRRALGYSHKEDKIFIFEGQPVIVPTVKHYPPDPTSGIFWLKNRQPAKWRDKVEASDDEGDVTPVKVVVNVVDASKKTDADA